MSRRLCHALLGVVGVALLCPATLWASVAISFDQVDYTQGGAPSVSNSEWGEFGVTYDQSVSLDWVNIVANPGTSDARWIVQNHPLLPSTLTGTSTFSSASYFDLGVTRGTDVTSLSILAEVSTSPLTSAPTSGTFETVPVGSSQNIINSGLPTGIISLNSPAPLTTNWNVPFANAQTTWHEGVPNVTQELNFCGPGAAANSLQWLNAQHKLGLQQTLQGTQAELAGNMENANNGNWDDKEVQGKLQYIIEHQLPLEVHYTGGVMLPTNGNFNAPNGNGTARNDGAISWDWLQEQLAQGQDVELMTNTHWVVMEGSISWDGVHLFSYRDDPFQKGNATTANQQQTIDNRHVWTYFSGGDVNIGNGNEKLRAAVAESPVPEPSSWFLLALGLCGIGLQRRRNTTP